MKKIIVLFITIILLMSLCACGRTYEEANTKSQGFREGYFTVIKTWGDSFEYGSSYIVYANDTKVMYYIEWSTHGRAITPLYNADGTLQIYQGE